MNDAHIGIQLADGSFYEVLAGGDQQARELILEPANPGQRSIRIRLVEGAEGRVIRTLGTVSLDDLAGNGSGVRLTLSRDPDGQVVASAEDMDSGNLQSFTVNPEDPSEMDIPGDDDSDFGEISFDDLDDAGVMPMADEEDGISLDDLSFEPADPAREAASVASAPSGGGEESALDLGEDEGSSLDLGEDPDLDDLDIGDFSFESGGLDGDRETEAEVEPAVANDPVAASGAELAEIDLGLMDDDFGQMDTDAGSLDDDYGSMDAGSDDALPIAAADDDSLDMDFDLPGESNGTIEEAGSEGFDADFSDSLDFSAPGPDGDMADDEPEDDYSADYSFEAPDAGDRFGAAVTAGLVLVSLAGMGGLTFLVFRLLQSAPIPSLTG